MKDKSKQAVLILPAKNWGPRPQQFNNLQWKLTGLIAQLATYMA